MAETAQAVAPLRYGQLTGPLSRPVEPDSSPMGRLVSAIADLPIRDGTIGEAVSGSLATIKCESLSDGAKATARQFLRALHEYLDDASQPEKWQQRVLSYVKSHFDPQLVGTAECLAMNLQSGDGSRTRAAMQRVCRLVSAKENAIKAINSTEMHEHVWEAQYKVMRELRVDGSRGEPRGYSEVSQQQTELTPVESELFNYWHAQEEVAKAVHCTDAKRHKGGRPPQWRMLEAMILENESRPEENHWTDAQLLSRYNRRWKGKSTGKGTATYPGAALAELRRVRTRLFAGLRVSDDTPSDEAPKLGTKPSGNREHRKITSD